MNNEKRYYLYIHTNLQNNKKYIGLTSLANPAWRWGHNGIKYKNNKHFWSAIQKYGWEEGFSHEIILSNLTFEEANAQEKFWIDYYDTTNPDKGYNNRPGGLSDFSYVMSEEQKNYLSKLSKNVPKNEKWHKAVKEYYEKTNGGHMVGRFGDLGNAITKKVRCVETGDVFSAISEAERWCNSTKVGECCRGTRKHAGHHPETGKILSWEYASDLEEVTIYCHKLIPNKHKKELSTNKKVICIETQKIYNSEAEACRAYGASRGTIGRACNGKRKTALKLHWKWIEGE